VEEGSDSGNECDAFALNDTRTVRLFLLVCVRARSFVRCISCVSGIVCVRARYVFVLVVHALALLGALLLGA
jgi:hypothetical protein